MNTNYVAALAAFLGGAVISVVNSLIMAKQVKAKAQSLSGTVVLRQILSFAYLALSYFAARKLGINMYWPLFGAAAGLTIPSILFAFVIAKQMKGDD